MAETKRGEYATIHAAIVDDPEFQALTPDARYVWYTLKLLLGASGIDLIRAHIPALGMATGYPIDRLSDSLDGLEKGGWLVRQGDVLWLRNALRFNPQFNIANPKHATHLRNHLEGLPRLKIVADFAAYYGMEAPFEPVETDSLSYSLSHSLYESGSGSGSSNSSGNGSGNAAENVEKSRHPELSTFLGSHADCLTGVDVMAQRSVWGIWGPHGTNAHEWRGMAQERQAPILATAILSWRAGKPERFYRPFFAKILERAIDDAIASGRQTEQRDTERERADDLRAIAKAKEDAEIARLNAEAANAAPVQVKLAAGPRGTGLSRVSA